MAFKTRRRGAATTWRPPDARGGKPFSIDAGAPVSPLGVGRFAFDVEKLPAARSTCERLRAVKSRCARDLDSELVTIGCEEVAFGTRELSSRCRGLEMCVPEVQGWTGAVCVKHRCVAQQLPSDLPPEQLCLDRALERAPRDKQPIIVELVPTTGDSVKAAAPNDSREVARCLERVIEQHFRSTQPVTLRYTPGERLEKFPPMTGRLPPLQTTPPPRPTDEVRGAARQWAQRLTMPSHRVPRQACPRVRARATDERVEERAGVRRTREHAVCGPRRGKRSQPPARRRAHRRSRRELPPTNSWASSSRVPGVASARELTTGNVC